MPQITKGGKFIFGWSVINNDYTVQIPHMAIEEYHVNVDKKVFLISGSKKTGGFCVTRKGLMETSKMKGVLETYPKLNTYEIEEGEFVKYKERLYCWSSITEQGALKLNEHILKTLNIAIGSKLLSIRGSGIAFVMGQRGPLIERANAYDGDIEIY